MLRTVWASSEGLPILDSSCTSQDVLAGFSKEFACTPHKEAHDRDSTAMVRQLGTT